MTKQNNKSREFWLDFDSKNDQLPRVFNKIPKPHRVNDSYEVVHVIEFKAYRKLQEELAEKQNLLNLCANYIERKLNSDDACNRPFDEDAAELLTKLSKRKEKQ